MAQNFIFWFYKKCRQRRWIREIYSGSKPNYDTIIFKVKNKNKREKIVNYLVKAGVGTKNLPDAIKWHCAFYWKHIFNKKELKKIQETKKILDYAIAIPIFFKKNISFYKKLSFEINKV